MGGKIKAVIITISISLYTPNLSAQETWTLQDCVKRAIEKNISIKQAEFRLKNYGKSRNNSNN